MFDLFVNDISDTFDEKECCPVNLHKKPIRCRGGCTACAGGGERDVCVRRDWFPSIKSLADKFLVFTHCLSSFWPVGIGYSVLWHFSVWLVWLFQGLPGRSRGDLRCLLGSLCLVLYVRDTLTMHAVGN